MTTGPDPDPARDRGPVDQPGWGVPQQQRGWDGPQGRPGWGPAGSPAGYGAPGNGRPGIVTGAGVVGIVWGALALLFGLVALGIVFSVSALLGLVVLVTVVLGVGLLIGGIFVLTGRSPKLLLHTGYAAIVINLVELVVSLAQNSGSAFSGVLGFVLPGVIVGLLRQPAAKEYFASRGHTC